MFMAMVNINIRAIKFDDITVTFHPSNPSNPVIIITEKKQLLNGIIIHIIFLNTNHRVAIIKNKTPKPKTKISFFMNTQNGLPMLYF